MRGLLVRLLEEQKPALHSCPVCPIKGACVFATPQYEPGYCLHEYRLLHAYLARRLRSHPSAGASDYTKWLAEAERLRQDVLGNHPHGAGAPASTWVPPVPSWPKQATLGQFPN